MAGTEIDYAARFYEDGVIVFQQIIPAAAILRLTETINRIHELVMRKVMTMPRPLKNYSDIAERQLGRFDYRCGFTADVFSEVADPIIKIIQTLSPQIDFRHYWGAIPSLSGSGPTDIHRDVYPFLNSNQGNSLSSHDINLPPYYMTVLLPLVQITAENGPTQFIKGSHRKLNVDESRAEIYAPLMSVGDIVIFDGRTLHRGVANKSQDVRLVAYITFVANWYHDQTFELNNYLFPELGRHIERSTS